MKISKLQKWNVRAERPLGAVLYDSISSIIFTGIFNDGDLLPPGAITTTKNCDYSFFVIDKHT